MSLGPGTRLGPYEILSAIGAGGMGEVYKARDTRLDRTVAIKVLPEHVAADPDLKQRFEREAKTISSLNHPHICTLYDVGNQDGIDFLVMEYLEGETLEQRLKRRAGPKGPGLQMDQALQIAIQIADALAAAHRAGIIHRDLKPGNIMLTISGAKLLDFGLAKLHPTPATAGISIAATVSRPLTGQGTLLGTLHYMAPEQVEGKDADSRSDIFAFGAVMYEMATGKRAFDGKSAASVIAAILEREPPAMSTLQPLTPPPLDHVVSQCLEKDPARRWETAGDVMRQLKWIAVAPGAGAAVTTTARHGSERVAWALLAVAVLGLIAFAVPTTRYVMRTVPAAAPLRLSAELGVEVSLDNNPGAAAALSPDGAVLAFVAQQTAGGRLKLYVRRLEQLQAAPLAGTDGATSPFFSPDGQWIAFSPTAS